MKRLPGHGVCFVCGEENSKGMGLTYCLDGQQIVAEFSYTLAEQGPPAHAHGGAITAVLDEAMGAAAWCSGRVVVAVHIEVDFVSLVPLHVDMRAAGWVDRTDGRKVYTCSELRNADGSVLARGKGIFLEVEQALKEELLKTVSDG